MTKVTRAEDLAAIRDGVRDAFLTAMSLEDNPVPCFRDDLLHAIGEAVATEAPAAGPDWVARMGISDGAVAAGIGLAAGGAGGGGGPDR